MNKQFPQLFYYRKEQGKQTFGFGITLERRLQERSSSIASENPVPVQQCQRIGDQEKKISHNRH